MFGFIPGSIVAGASAGAKLQAAPGFVKYIVYTLNSGCTLSDFGNKALNRSS